MSVGCVSVVSLYFFIGSSFFSVFKESSFRLEFDVVFRNLNGSVVEEVSGKEG